MHLQYYVGWRSVLNPACQQRIDFRMRENTLSSEYFLRKQFDSLDRTAFFRTMVIINRMRLTQANICSHIKFNDEVPRIKYCRFGVAPLISL